MRVKVIWCNGPTNLLICNIEPCIGWVDNFAPYLMSVHIICMGLIGAVSNFATKNGWFMIICPIRSLTLGILLYFRSWDRPRYALKPHISKKKKLTDPAFEQPHFSKIYLSTTEMWKIKSGKLPGAENPDLPMASPAFLGPGPTCNHGKVRTKVVFIQHLTHNIQIETNLLRSAGELLTIC
jgi:hypothetical protein